MRLCYIKGCVLYLNKSQLMTNRCHCLFRNCIQFLTYTMSFPDSLHDVKFLHSQQCGWGAGGSPSYYCKFSIKNSIWHNLWNHKVPFFKPWDKISNAQKKSPILYKRGAKLGFFWTLLIFISRFKKWTFKLYFQ